MSKIFSPSIVVTLSFLAFAGCGGDPAPKVSMETPQSETPAVSAPVAGSKSVDAATAGSVVGKVSFTGEVPAPKQLPIKGNPECSVFHPDGVRSEELLVKDGAVQNVFIYVKNGLEAYSFPPPTDSVTIDNKHCHYIPHVAGVQVDQPLMLLNSDPTLHNVHSYAKNSKGWNLGLPFQGMKQTKKFEAEEVMVTLKCDVHPWMIGYLGVLKHPYFAVTGEAGTFELKNLPPGEVVLEAWHEKLGTRSQSVTIGPQETKTVEFNFTT